jgi:hypothetical protein
VSLVAPFHSYENEDGEKLVYHNQSECEHGQEIVRNGHKVDGDGGRPLCEGCADLAGGK